MKVAHPSVRMVIVVSAGLACSMAAPAVAATTRLVWDVSVNGAAYASSVSPSPGDQLRFRLRVSLTNNTGFGSIPGSAGLGGFYFRPTLTNFGLLDTAVPLDAEEFATGHPNNPVPLTTVNHSVLGPVEVYTGPLPIPDRHGPGAPANGTGRTAPFGVGGTNGTGLATSSVESGTLVWTSPQGGAGGVLISQYNPPNSRVSVVGLNNADTPDDESDDFVDGYDGGSFANNSRSNVTVFTYDVVLGSSHNGPMTAGCEMITAPVWYTNNLGAYTSAANVVVVNAVVNVPAPGGVALLGLAGVFASRRRR